jgi:hypothetical protein
MTAANVLNITFSFYGSSATTITTVPYQGSSFELLQPLQIGASKSSPTVVKLLTKFKQYIFAKFEHVMMGKPASTSILTKDVVSKETVQQYFSKYASDDVANYYELQGPQDVSYEDYKVCYVLTLTLDLRRCI